MSTHTVSLKQTLKGSALYKPYHYCRRKWQNYFASQGMVFRKINQHMVRYDDEIKLKQRKIATNKIIANIDPKLLDIVSQVKQHGFALLKFSDFNIDPTSVYGFLGENLSHFEANKSDQNFLTKMNPAYYGDRIISYSFYKRSAQIDPLLELSMNPQFIQMAAVYLGYIPFVDVSMEYTPLHQKPIFGSQLWHRDTHHKNLFRIFFSPVEVSKKSGPFQFFPPNKSSLAYVRNYPEAMTDDAIRQSGLNPNECITAELKPGEFLLTDSEACLHRGGLTYNKRRFHSWISYSSPVHCFSKKEFRNTGHHKLAFDVFGDINEQLYQKYTET